MSREFCLEYSALTGKGAKRDKSFDQTFSKVCGVQGQSPWARLAGREIPCLFHEVQPFHACERLCGEAADSVPPAA